MTPSNLSEIQPRVWRVLSRSYQGDRMAGTYLFCGPDGCGRWTTAISLAALVNCEKPVPAAGDATLLQPCGTCRTCRTIASYNFEGLIFAVPLPPHKNSDEAIDLTTELLEHKRQEPLAKPAFAANVTIPIETARQVKRELSRQARAGLRRVVVFYKMERMLPASADALLKLVEEPPADTIIILITENPDALLPTIQSRAQKIRFDRTDVAVVARYLESNYEITPKRASLLARMSQGIIGEAIALTATDEDGESFRQRVAWPLFRSLIEESGPTTVARVVTLTDNRNRGQAEELLRLWQSFIRDSAGVAAAGEGVTIVNADFEDELKRLATYFVSPRLGLALTEEIKLALAHMRRNVHIHGALSALALRVKASIS